MSGAVAAHAAYNGSGTQGLAVTNKIQGNDGDVMSVFWNKNDTTRQLLYGSAFVEIPSSSGSGGNALSKANTQIFEVNNDIDCLGNLVLKVLIDNVVPTAAQIQISGGISSNSTSVTGTGFTANMLGALFSDTTGSIPANTVVTAVNSTTSLTISNAALTTYNITGLLITPLAFIEPCAAANIIDRIEFQVGTQIWQTLEKVDILALATTELPESAYSDFIVQSSGGYSKTIGLNPITSFGVIGTSTPTNTYYSSTANGIIAYIPLKMLTKTLAPQLESFSEHTESGYLMAAAPNQQVKIKIYTSVRGTNTTFTTTTLTPPNTTFTNIAFANATISLSLFAQQHVMCNEEREQMLAVPNGLPRRIKMTQNVQQAVTTASTSFNIVLDTFSLYASHLIISIPSDVLTFTTHYAFDASTVELLLNSSSFSGALPFGLLNVIPSSLGLYNNNYITDGTGQNPYEVFVFPLASRAYGGSGVPLNRFDNITLKFKLPAAPSVAGTIYVTCVGETTALYKGGAASLAMY